MILAPGVTTFLTLGILAEIVVAAPSPTPRGGESVRTLFVLPLPQSPLNASKISWGGCETFGVNSTDPNFQCGYLQVPMDYHDSSAGNARLAVIKYAATAKKLGSLFFNPGHSLYPRFLSSG